MKPVVKEEEEIEILTKIRIMIVSEFLSHAENATHPDTAINDHAYHSNGESLVYNYDNAQ